MNKRIIAEGLEGALNDRPCCIDLEGLIRVQTFAELGFKGVGLVLFFKSGEAFQLTIKRAN